MRVGHASTSKAFKKGKITCILQNFLCLAQDADNLHSTPSLFKSQCSEKNERKYTSLKITCPTKSCQLLSLATWC